MGLARAKGCGQTFCPVSKEETFKVEARVLSPFYLLQVKEEAVAHERQGGLQPRVGAGGGKG